MAEEEFEEEEIEEAPRSRSRAGRSGGGGGGASELLGSVVAFASKHRVPLMVGGGFLLFYWVGHRRGARAAQASRPVTQIYMPAGGGYRTGIQSSSPMYDPRFFDPPDGVDAY
jgi:hypothetical protein